MESEVSFGAWVTRQRKALDLTRDQLARCMGCSVSALRKIESDERRPSRQMAELLAQCLQIPPDEHPRFIKVARGIECVERLGTPLSVSAAVRSSLTPPYLTSNLPTPPTPLIGREAELATLARLIRDPQCRLLTLVGPGGIGKTRLAIGAASAQRELFSAGVYFVSLVSLSSPQFIVPAVADALGFLFSSPTNPQVQLLNYLREKRMLLVLDNFEHLLAPPFFPPPRGGKRGGRAVGRAAAASAGGETAGYFPRTAEPAGGVAVRPARVAGSPAGSG